MDINEIYQNLIDEGRSVGHAQSIIYPLLLCIIMDTYQDGAMLFIGRYFSLRKKGSHPGRFSVCFSNEPCPHPF